MKTAVEHFREQIVLNSKIKENSEGGASFTIGLSKIDELFLKAQEMEKQQIMQTRQDIYHTGDLDNEQYYNKTFKP
jgi:hypothetical protein